MGEQFSGRARVRELTSATNSLVKVFRKSLVEGVTREGWLAGEGPHFLAEALKLGSAATLHSVLVAQSSAGKYDRLLKQIPRDAEITHIPDRLFRQIAQTEAPQGIAALIERPAFDLQAILKRPSIVLMVACGVQDPGNMGTMIRSADALGAAAVVALQGTVSPFNPKAVRSCVGSIFRLPVFANLEPSDLFKRLRACVIRIIAASRESPTPVAGADLRGPLAILIGNEAAGFAPEIAREADERVSIPICEHADSLNAAVAASIILYEVVRQRGFSH